jgi:hypothetical protein
VPYRLVQPTDGRGQPLWTQVLYTSSTRDDLHGIGPQAVRQIGATDGPFAHKRDDHGNPVWRSVDDEAFSAVIARGRGAPIGNITLALDDRNVEDRGSVCQTTLPGRGPENGSRTLDFSVKIGRWEEFINAKNSLFLRTKCRWNFFYLWGVKARPLKSKEMERRIVLNLECL